MTAFHQVVFTGELRPGVNAEQAARDFAAVFKIPEEKAWRLILNKREHVLKREVDDANAERYREVLEEIGLQVRVEPSGTPLSGNADAGAGAAEAAARAPTHDQGDDTARATGGAMPPGSSPKTSPKASPAELTDPYAPPQADLVHPTPDDDGPMSGPQSVPAGHGWLWLKDAYALFRAKPGTWIGAIAMIYLIGFVVGLVPFVGGLAGFLLGPVFAGGLMAGARELDRHGTARPGLAFDGFSGPAAQLMLLGLLYLLGFILISLISGLILVTFGVISSAGVEALSSGDPEAVATVLAPTALLLMLLIVMALALPLVMAYWFAPALVMLEGMTALEAMQASFLGCWMNILPFLVYGLALLGIGLGFALAAGIIAGLAAAVGPAAAVVGFIGVVLAVPLMLGFAAVAAVSQYTGYRDIFRHVG
jgi:uncharacterized membrane protein